MPLEGGTVISALRNPYDEDLTVGLVLSGDLESLRSLAPRIPHYTKYSYLAFTGSQPVLSGVWKVDQSPLRADLTER
jgi:aminopeptidase N